MPNNPGHLPGQARSSGARLHIVTGKGGTGKTTFAAALALKLASDGKRTLLAEVEGRQGIAQLFDVPPLTYTERKIAVAPGGGEVFGVSIEPKAALLEYLDLFYHLGGAGKLLEKAGAIDFATTVAPGVRDVLLTGKVYEAARRKGTRGGWAYDAVVLDGPPTGRIGRFLNVNEEVVDLAKVGPIRKQAESIMKLLRSPASIVHLVTVLEEMPVQETEDGIAELRRGQLPIGHIIVNMVREQVLPDGHLDAGEVAAGLVSAGLLTPQATASRGRRTAQPTPALVAGLLQQAEDHNARVDLEAEQLEVVLSLGQPVITLPALPEGIDLGSLYELAEGLDLTELPIPADDPQLAPQSSAGGANDA